MRNRLNWTRNTYGETETRIYRDTAPLDVNNLPAPIGTVGQGVVTYEDNPVSDQTTYYYVVAAVYQGVEYPSAVLEKFVDGFDAAIADSFDSLDLSLSPNNHVQEAADLGAEVVAAFRDGAIAENSVQSSSITTFGQHKWPHNLTDPIGRMWILARDNASGDVLRIYAVRSSASDPNTVINSATTWDFEALWRGTVASGTGTWEFSEATVSFSNSSLSSDDGSWAFKDGSNTQGDQSQPSSPLFGVGNWNGGDTSAVMTAGSVNYNDFQGIVIFAPPI